MDKKLLIMLVFVGGLCGIPFYWYGYYYGFSFNEFTDRIPCVPITPSSSGEFQPTQSITPITLSHLENIMTIAGEGQFRSQFSANNAVAFSVSNMSIWKQSSLEACDDLYIWFLENHADPLLKLESNPHRRFEGNMRNFMVDRLHQLLVSPYGNVWSLETMRITSNLNLGYDDYPIPQIAIDPQSGDFLTTHYGNLRGATGRLILWQYNDNNSLTPEVIFPNYTRAFDFNGVIAAFIEGSLQLYDSDLRTFTSLNIANSPDLSRLTLSPDGQYLVGQQYADGWAVYVWDVETGDLLIQTLSGGSFQFSSNSEYFAFANASKLVLWKLDQPEQPYSVISISNAPDSLIFHPTEPVIALGESNSVQFLSFEGDLLHSITQSGEIIQLEFNDTGTLLAIHSSGRMGLLDGRAYSFIHRYHSEIQIWGVPISE